MLSSVLYEDRSIHMCIHIPHRNTDIHTHSTYITQTYLMHACNTHTQMIKNTEETINFLSFEEAHYK